MDIHATVGRAGKRRIPIIHMTEGNIFCRCPEQLYGKRFSVISLGQCNFRCPYCQLGGGLRRNGQRIPLAIDIELREVEAFIDDQAAKGNPIKVSGGEPTVDMELTLHLLDRIRAQGAYACVDTSGWCPERTALLAQRADQMAIDLKGPLRYVSAITGVSRQWCWDAVLESIVIGEESDAILEVRTVIFDFTTGEDVRQMARHIPAQSFWLLRRFLTDWVPFDKYGSSRYAGEHAQSVTYPDWLSSPCAEKMRRVVYSALGGDTRLPKRRIVLVHSPRDSMGELLEDLQLESST